MEFKKYFEENEFLYDISSNDSKAEIEVTEYAVGKYKNQYPVYENDKWKVCGNENTRRCQMSTKGCYLSKNDDNCPNTYIDVAADILTSKNVPLSIVKDNEELEKYVLAYVKVYYTIGNMLPVAEGGNPGFGRCPIDNFTYKLDVIKDIFLSEEINESLYDEIDKMIGEGKTLGRKGYKKIFSYWIQKEWKGSNKSWENFIEDNCLQDLVCLVNNRYESKEIILSRNGKKNYMFPKDAEEQKKWFINITKLIIERGFRLKYHKERLFFDDAGKHTDKAKNILIKIFSEIFKDIDNANLTII
ncbi:MAG: hypothetical protein J6L69_01850 [Lachnospiraceae bacterium]|nr:hypothetical protein [Lachnospiraceae bacterium]